MCGCLRVTGAAIVATLLFLWLGGSERAVSGAAQPASGPAGAATRPATGPATKATTAPATAHAVAPPPTAAELFERAFGKESREVARAGPAARVVLARKMLAAAADPTASPELQAILCGWSVTLAVADRSGYPLALRALERLRTLRPDHLAEYDERMVGLLEKMYVAAKAGEEKTLLAGPYSAALLDYAVAATHPSTSSGLRGAPVDKLRTAQEAPETYAAALSACLKAEELAHTLSPERAAAAADVTLQIGNRQRVARRVAELKSKADSGHADDDSMEELSVLLLGVFDDTDSALVYAGRAPGTRPLERARSAVAPVDKLTDAEWARRADWYRAWGERLAGPAGPYLLYRASDEYARLLTARTRPGVFRTQVLASVERTCKASERGTGGGTTRPLFLPPAHGRLLLSCAGIDQPVSGSWQRIAGGVSCETVLGKALLNLTAAPPGEYEIAVDFTSRGASGVGIVLPVGAASIDLLRNDTECGLGQVQGSWRPFDVKLTSLSRDAARHTLYAKVKRGDPAAVTVKLDGGEVGTWAGKEADLTPIPVFVMPVGHPIGLCVREGAATFYGVCMTTATDIEADAGAPSLPSTDIPADGTRPGDAVMSIAPTAGSVYHDLVTLSVDQSQGRPVFRLAAADPSPEFHAVHTGFTTMMSATTNVAELRLGTREYQRLVALSQSAPVCCSDADAARLGALYGQCATAVGEEAREAAERDLFVALHRLGENYRKACGSWLDQVRTGTTVAQFKLILKFGQT